jgi:hypothetical protein
MAIQVKEIRLEILISTTNLRYRHLEPLGVKEAVDSFYQQVILGNTSPFALRSLKSQGAQPPAIREQSP